MGGNVFANGMEISGKAGGGSVIAAFPDVCLSPPSPPAGPLPIPYPVSSQDSDTTDGSKSVRAGGKEVMLKDKSYFKKCTGDEAATQSQGKGVMNATLSGKVYFIAWSMDVEIEGENAVRHLDLTTSNHASPLANAAAPKPKTKTSQSGDAKKQCKKTLKEHPVQSYDDQKGDAEEGFQSHHVVQNSHFQYPRGTTIKEICSGYSEGAAPCILLEGGTNPKTPHGAVSKIQKADAKRYRDRVKQGGKNPAYREARKDAKKQLMAKNPGPGLTAAEAECILKEVDKMMRQMCKKKSMADQQLRAPGQRGKGFKPKKTAAADKF